MVRRVLLGIVGLCISFSGMADAIIPTQIQWLFSKGPGEKTDECGLTLAFSNYPGPEIGLVRFSLISSKTEDRSVFGFAINLADVIYKNGKPVSHKDIPLADGAIEADNFSSRGRLHSSIQEDGSLWLWASEYNTALDMSNAVLFNKISVYIKRKNSENIRLYVIGSGPPPDKVHQFNECGMHMLSGR